MIMHSLYDIISPRPKINLLSSDLCNQKKIELSILRLDEIHPVVSGNKLFKLKYFLNEARQSRNKTVITFGGAYSNHLAATAFACRIEGLKSIGFVRGGEPTTLSTTLSFCRANDMQLEFISRSDYKNIDEEFKRALFNKYGDHTQIPEGGFSTLGAKGAEDILSLFNGKNYSHICCTVGTATTFAGLVNGNIDASTIVGFSVLKNLDDIENRLRKLNVDVRKDYEFIRDYHFDGYAKKTKGLIDFINKFYQANKIPLDFVYTGKMMFGVYDLASKNYFRSGSRILCIHTGGLQGNDSLPAGTLNF